MINQIISTIDKYNSILNGLVWGIPMLCLILGTGIFYSIRSGFFQVRKFKDVLDNTVKGLFAQKKSSNKKEGKKVLTQFQALSTALASTIGTGNIAGVSSAIVVGGPGAVFWMWICAIFGMMTHFAEVTLGMYFRKYDKVEGYSGGPMYYLEYGVGKELKMPILGKTLAVLFALFTFLASYGIGNMTQINSISDALKSNFGLSTLYCGIIFAIIAAIIIFGGIRRIGSVAEKIVPFMACFYIIVGLVIVFLNIKNVPSVFVSIVTGAFNTKAIAGGALGIVLKRAITMGFKRGAFSNEAGIGTSVIAHSTSSEKEPVKQAYWGIFEVFFDTIIVCTFTALIILSSTLKAPSLDEALLSLTDEEKIVCVDNTFTDKNGDVRLVDNNYYKMPIKLDEFGNAKVEPSIPNNGKEYVMIKVFGSEKYIEKADETDLNSDSYFFGNVLKVKAHPVYHEDGSLVKDDKGEVMVDSIHIENVSGVSLVTLAISNKLSHWAGKLIAIAVTLFAFTTLVGWSYYGTQTIEYIFGHFATYVYKVFYIVFIVVGSIMSLNLVWNVADTMNGFMAIPNLIGVFLLSGVVFKITKNFYDRKAGKKVKDMTSYHI